MNAFNKPAVALASAGLGLSSFAGLYATPAYAGPLTPVTSGHVDIVDVDCENDEAGDVGSAVDENPIDASTHEFVFTDNGSTVKYNNTTDQWEISVGSPGTESPWVGFAYDEAANCDPENADDVSVGLLVLGTSGAANNSVSFVSTNAEPLGESTPLALAANDHKHGTWYIDAGSEADATVELEFDVSINGGPATPITTTFTVNDTP